MNARKGLPLLLLTGLLTVVSSACIGPADLGVGIQVSGPPPAYRHESRLVRPGPDFIWVDGYWDWRGGGAGYEWVPGAWVRPPRAHARWERPRWQHRRGGTFYIAGHWRN